VHGLTFQGNGDVAVADVAEPTTLAPGRARERCRMMAQRRPGVVGVAPKIG
jgi:hypothetical protein